MNSDGAPLPYPEEIRNLPLGAVEVLAFQPSQHHVVMGAAGKTHLEVYPEHMDGIALYKRKGGGGTVLLGPETIVVTVHAGVSNPFGNQAYFKAINGAMIQVFQSWRNLAFQQKGLSDIAVDERKIVGTSIYRRKQYLLYQASILVKLNMPLMEKVLKPPPRQPDYRRNRDHRQFVTCLRDLGIDLDIPEMVSDLQQGLPGLIDQALRELDKR